MNNLLIEDDFLLEVYPSFAKEVGLVEAVISSFLREVGRPVSASEITSYLGFLSLTSVKKALTELEGYGLVEEVTLSCPEEIKEEVISFKDIDKKTCEWCGKGSIVLHEHHFPVPRRRGGDSVVNICPNCHYGFHYMETRRVVIKKEWKGVYDHEER